MFCRIWLSAPAHLLRLVDVGEGAARLPVAGLVDADEGQRSQRREQQAHGHSSEELTSA